MARKRRKGRKPYIRKTLLKYEETSTGYRKYKIKNSQIREAELERLIKRANDRLYKLEKAGLTEKSQEYRMVEHYALGDPSGKGSIYNVREEKGTIRFKTTTKNMTASEKAYFINTLRNFLNAETSTITGTRKSFKKAYESFMKNNGSKIDMSPEQYEKVWQTYRDMVEKDKLSNEGYNAFMELITTTDLYTMDRWQIEEALSYIDKSEKVSTSGIVSDVIDNMKMEEDVEITKV